MLISIVVPAYNAQRFLAEAVESVLAQAVSDWELVLGDDGSTDDTWAVANAYERADSRIRALRQENTGVAVARNRGLAACRAPGGYAIFLDADDVWERDALQVLVGTLEAAPGAAAASGLSRMIDATGQPCEPGELEVWGRHRAGVAGGRLVAWPVTAPTTLHVLAYQNYISTPGQVLIRRAVLEAVGGFDPACTPCEDRDMWIRLAQRGDIAFADRVVLNWRTHTHNASRDRELMLRKQRYVRCKLLSSPALSDQQRRVVLAAHWLWGLPICSARLRWAARVLLQGEPSQAVRELRRAVADYVTSARGMPIEAPVFRPSLRQLYRSARAAPSEISPYLDVLLRLARQSRHVTELTSGGGTTTSTLLSAKPSVLVSYNTQQPPGLGDLVQAAQGLRHTRFVFRQADLLDVEVEETDMLFTDAWHTYEQLKRQLALHAGRVRKYLVFHGTTAPCEAGAAPGSRGAWPAIEEFLCNHPEWALTARFTHKNGLTILARQGHKPPSLAGSGWLRRQRSFR